MADKVVFDTNVWISGLLWRGKSYQCLLFARSGVVQVVYCPPIIAELSEKLRSKFNFSEDKLHATVYDIKRYAQRVEITGQLHVVYDDPDDDKFVECAIVAGAPVIVSADHHLLELKQYQGIDILSPVEFVTGLR